MRGTERLSVERLYREHRDAGLGPDDVNHTVYEDYGFHLADLREVVEALDPPAGFRTPNGVFSGEEGVLLLLRRFRTTGPLSSIARDAGRNVPQVSEAVRFMVEHVRERFAHLIDERSFISWERYFDRFAAAFRERGLPIDNLVGFIDSKLQPICRPGRYQQAVSATACSRARMIARGLDAWHDCAGDVLWTSEFMASSRKASSSRTVCADRATA